MRIVVRNLNEMSDSRELLESRAHPFITLFIAILGVILAAAIMWSYFGTIDIVTKASGSVKPNHKISTVSNKAAGTVTNVMVKAGQKVKAGDLLLTMDYGNMEVDQQSVENDLKKSKANVAELIAFKQSADSDKLDGKLIGGMSDKYRVQWRKIELSLQAADAKVENLQKLSQSIEQGRNLLPSDSEYYNQYEEYALKLQQHELARSNSQALLKTSMQGGEQGGEEAAKRQLIDTELQAKSYKNDLMGSIRSGIKQGEQDRLALAIERDNLTVQLNEQIEAEQARIKELNNQLHLLQVNKNDREIHAPIDGIANIVTEVSVGDNLMAGTKLLTIIPEHGTEYVVQMAVRNQDIASFKPGDHVKYSFQAIPAQEYGHLSGEIQHISADAAIDQASGVSYYLVEASVSSNVLSSKSGEKKQIKVGMTTEAHIVTDRQKILFWLLHRLNLRD